MRKQNSNHQLNCDQARALIPAYAIGATDQEETALVDAMLEACPELIDDLADYMLLAEDLLHVLPDSQAPMSAAEALAPIFESDRHRGNQQSNIKPQHQHHANETHHLMRPDFTTPIQSIAPEAESEQKQPAPPPPRRDWFMRIAAVAAILVFAIINLYWIDSVRTLRDEQQALIQTVQQNDQPTDPQIEPDVLLSLGAEEQHHRELLPSEIGSVDAHATIVWATGSEVGSVIATGLPELPGDRAYQLWLVRGDESISLGQFRVDSNGDGSLVFQSPEPIDSFEAIGISIESAEGSSEPTTPHLVIGQI